MKKEIKKTEVNSKGKVKQVKKEKLVYIDEAGFDNREDYPYGYSPKVERCYALKSGKKRERTSSIAAFIALPL